MKNLNDVIDIICKQCGSINSANIDNLLFKITYTTNEATLVCQQLVFSHNLLGEIIAAIRKLYTKRIFNKLPAGYISVYAKIDNNNFELLAIS